MEKFNLEKALAGAKLVTRDGDKVINFMARKDRDERHDYPYMASVVIDSYCVATAHFTKDGRYSIDFNGHRWDLFLDEEVEVPKSTSVSQLSEGVLVDTLVFPDRIELIYKESPNCTWTVGIQPKDRVYKVVYSCKEGKWHVSEKIYGEIIPVIEERYEFK